MSVSDVVPDCVGVAERVGYNAADATALKSGWFFSVSSVGPPSGGSVSVRPTSVGPSVGHGLCTVMPDCVGVSEQVGENAADVTAL